MTNSSESDILNVLGSNQQPSLNLAKNYISSGKKQSIPQKTP